MIDKSCTDPPWRAIQDWKTEVLAAYVNPNAVRGNI